MPRAMVNIQAPVQQQPQQQSQPQQQQQPQQQSPAATNTPEGVQITNVQKTTNKFYWGLNTCGPVKMTLNIQVSNAGDVFQVVVFNRLWSSEGEGFSRLGCGLCDETAWEWGVYLHLHRNQCAKSERILTALNFIISLW